MKFSVGDKMLIKKTGEEGYIVSFIDKTMAEVSVGKTTFPIHLDEIDHPYLYWFTKKNKEEQKKKVLREQIPLEKTEVKQIKVASGIHLTFMPVFQTVEMEERVERLKIFIVNHSHFTIELRYDVRVDNTIIFNFLGTIQPFTDVYLHYLDWEMMQNIPRFEWSLRETLSSQYVTQEDVLKIRSVKLFEQINTLLQNNTATFQYTLLEDFPMKKKEVQKFKLESLIPKTTIAVKSVSDIPKYELDLHIENLLDNVKGLSSQDILITQLAELQKYLRIAVNNRQDKMVVIHGLGKGVLRNEVQRVLKENSNVERVESGWQAGYGFGATIAYFHY